MTARNTSTEDEYGRQVHPVLCNAAKDGSGTWYYALVDSSGRLVTTTFRGTASLSNSGVLSADTSVKATAGDVYWLTVTDTAALALELNDSTANGGTDLWAIDIPADGYAHFIFDPPIEFGTGIYLDVSTATCKVTIGYI